MSGAGPPSAGAGPSGGGYQHQHAAAPSGGSSNTASAPAQATQNLNQIVTDYLLKRGFTKTEEVFRKESANLGPDGKPIHKSADEFGARKFAAAFRLLRDWVDNNLDHYKADLSRTLWPVFVYSYLELVEDRYPDDAKAFLTEFRGLFEDVHGDDLKNLSTVTLPQHILENNTTKLYRSRKYRIPVTGTVQTLLFGFLQREEEKGGSIIIGLLATYCEITTLVLRRAEPYSFEAIYNHTQNQETDESEVEEGIAGAFTGVRTKGALDGSLKLGPMPMEPELRDDVRAELDEEDQKNPVTDGRPSLVEELDRRIKREESADAPSRSDLPLPSSRAMDVAFEVEKSREHRNRFRIEGRTGGTGIPVSVCMFTFHNSLGSFSCMTFSNDHELVAVGTMDSYIRVWSLNGKPLKSRLETDKDPKVNNRKLIGHSGPVFGVSFSDSISQPLSAANGTDGRSADTSTKLLLSCSADGQIRLWSLDLWSCLCIFRGHEGPVFRVLWGPHGHYFASAGWDKTVRIFSQDHASALRLCVGHDTSVSALAWHPNGTYVFSASDETDKSIRMWSVQTGECVRIFTGHTDYVSALECAPNGHLLASADIGGNVVLWDLAKGTRIKRCRGHGKGGIPSLSFSAESNVLVSGGLDGAVRVWDVKLPADPSKASGATAISAQPAAVQDGSAAAGGEAGGGGDSIAVGGGGPADRTITVGGQPPQPSASSTGNTAATATATIAATANTTTTTTTGSGNVGGGSGGGGGGGGGKKKGKEVMITPDQISAFPTKKTPVMKVQFTRMNLIVAGGCYDPER